MLNCANQTLLERRLIPPAAGEYRWQTALCCQPFSGIALAAKSMPKVMSPFWIQLLNYTERRNIKSCSPHPNWEQLSRTIPVQTLLCPYTSTSGDPKSTHFKANNSPALQFPSQDLLTSKSDLQQYENFKTPTYSSLTSCLKRK